MSCLTNLNTHSACQVFIARRYADAVGLYAMAPCLSVCLSQVGVLLKQLNPGSRK